MAKRLNIQSINRSDSEELKVSKENWNFGHIAGYVFSLASELGSIGKKVSSIESRLSALEDGNATEE